MVGSNVPVVPFVIPVPDQVPPASTAVKLTAASVWQKGPAAEIVTSQGVVQSAILISKVSATRQVPVVV